MGTIRELLERYKEASLKDGHQEHGTDSSVLIAETAERRPSKECHEFWRGIHHEVSKREETEGRAKGKSDDPDFSRRDEELRSQIAEIYLPNKRDVDIPEWKEKTSG